MTRNNPNSWCANVRNLLERYGFSDVWYNDTDLNEYIFLSVYKQRLIDEFLQEWLSNIHNTGTFNVYSALKSSFEFEAYLENIVSR